MLRSICITGCIHRYHQSAWMQKWYFHYMYHKLNGSVALRSANTSICQQIPVPHVRISLQLEILFPCLITTLFYMREGAHIFLTVPEMVHEICFLKFLSLLRVLACYLIIGPVETRSVSLPLWEKILQSSYPQCLMWLVIEDLLGTQNWMIRITWL